MEGGHMQREDFNMSLCNSNGTFVKLEEINKMISDGVLNVNEEKLLRYKFDSSVIYTGDRDEAFNLWRQYL